MNSRIHHEQISCVDVTIVKIYAGVGRGRVDGGIAPCFLLPPLRTLRICPPTASIASTLPLTTISHHDCYNCLFLTDIQPVTQLALLWPPFVSFSTESPERSFYNALQISPFILLLKTLQRLATALGIGSKVLTKAAKVPCHAGWLRSPIAPCAPPPATPGFLLLSEVSGAFLLPAASERLLCPDCLTGGSFLQTTRPMSITSAEESALPHHSLPSVHGCLPPHCPVLPSSEQLLATQVHLLIYGLFSCCLPLSPECKLSEQKEFHLAPCCNPDAQNSVSDVVSALSPADK